METEEKDMLRRTNNQIHSSGEGQGCHKATLSSIPTRFQRKDPKRPRFDPSLVTKALEGKPRSRSLRQVASALLQKDSKTRVGRQGKEKRLFSVEEEEGRLAEGDLPHAREAQIENTEVAPEEGDLNLISVEMDAGEEGERNIETLEKEEADILRRENKDEKMMKPLPKVEADMQSEVCSLFTHPRPPFLFSK